MNKKKFEFFKSVDNSIKNEKDQPKSIEDLIDGLQGMIGVMVGIIENEVDKEDKAECEEGECECNSNDWCIEKLMHYIIADQERLDNRLAALEKEMKEANKEISDILKKVLKDE